MSKTSLLTSAILQYLQRDYYDASLDQIKPSKLKVMKMSDFFNHPNPHKVVNEYDVQVFRIWELAMPVFEKQYLFFLGQKKK